MSNIITIPITQPPSTIKVVVDYYDDNNKNQLLSSTAQAVLVAAQLPKTIEISTANFLTFYLFYKKRPGTKGYTKYHEIKSKNHQALIELDGLVEFDNGSVRATSIDGQNTGTTERLGEAIGLSVISQLHQLTDLDWTKIPETPSRRTLDYEYSASDGQLMIKTETKGSIIENNRRKTSTISHHKEKIEAKKAAERSSPQGSNAILYGTIAVLDNQPSSVARCWVLDPPVNLDYPPRSFRIIARMQAIMDLIAFISPRSQLAAALQARLDALRAVTSIEELDGIPLHKGDGSEFATHIYDPREGHNPWFNGKSCVADGPAGGQVFPLDRQNLFFIGLREELVTTAIKQSFGDLNSLKFPPGTIYKRVNCSIPRGRFKAEFPFLRDQGIESSERDAYVRFDLEGYLHYSSGGMVFGVLPLLSA